MCIYVCINLDQWFSTTDDPPPTIPRGHLVMSEDIFGYHNLGLLLASLVEIRDNAKHPTMDRTSLNNKELSDPCANSAKTVKFR